MTTIAASLEVQIAGRDISLEALLNRLEQKLRQSDQTGQRTSTVLGTTLAGGQRQAANGALALASAESRLARDMGDLQGAAQRLRNVLAQQQGTTVQVVNARRQLLAVEKQL